MPGNTMLVVDDYSANLTLFKTLFTMRGYQVQTARDAEQALDALKTFRPRVVLTDMELPDLSGLELTRRIKADPAQRDVTVLGITAHPYEWLSGEALDAGCDGYIAKPVSCDALLDFVAKHLPGA